MRARPRLSFERPKRRRRRAAKGTLARTVRLFLLRGLIAFLGLSILMVILYGFLPPPITPLMVLRYFDDETFADEIRRDWRPLEQISPHVFRAVAAAEDARYCDHGGFDWEEVRRTWERYRRDGRLRGASTISMQTAKNVFLWPGRSYLRKALEAYYTVLIELFWSKDRIFEVYVNSVEWGDGIFGVEAAAQAYWGKPAARLSPLQAARLAAVLPNPRIWQPDEPTGYIRERTATILARMRAIPIRRDDLCG